jgi:2'-5' RNA ligase
MEIQLPDRSLDAQFATLWSRFSNLKHTVDGLVMPTIRLRRWLTPINISFIVPIDDEQVSTYLIDAQNALAPYMHYAPQPSEKLHITLFMIGYLRTGLPLRYTWARDELPAIVEKSAQMFAKLPNFTVRVGPINAFPNVAIAEVRDEGQLRLLERAASSIIPEARRMPPMYQLLPHITLGYWGRRPVAPIAEVMRPMRQWPMLPLRVDRVAMTLYYRGMGAYDRQELLERSVEEVIATIPLNKRQRAGEQ